MNAALQEAVFRATQEATGFALENPTLLPLDGGCINQAFELHGEDLSYFLKLNSAELLTMFEREIEALDAINCTNTVRVPQPIAVGTAEDHAFLVLEYCPLGEGNSATAQVLGEKLAEMHRHSSPDGRFGWFGDNFIGRTPQPNAWHDRWVDFWREERLEHQFRLAEKDGRHFARADRLLNGLDVFFKDHEPKPSLLHGDLWIGNVAVTDTQTPFIYDPASYYGDRETDLAMTRLFGSLPQDFYKAYHAAYPLPDGHEVRRELYNLYHVLNHAHLFGGHYHNQAQAMIDDLVRLT